MATSLQGFDALENVARDLRKEFNERESPFLPLD